MSSQNICYAAGQTVALLGLALGLSACGPADTGPPSAEVRGGGSPGQILFLTYCQSCHGASGRGDGPVAASLRTPPPDLTQLSERYGTPLDRERLAEYIDGRQLFTVHGPRQMPIWGNEFFEDAPPTTNPEPVKRRLIDVLVDYLETLQSERQT